MRRKDGTDEKGSGAWCRWTDCSLGDRDAGEQPRRRAQEIGAYLPPFRRAADAIEGSSLDYTILRPAWLTDHDEVDYETTEKDEPVKGTEVSRKSVADLVVKIIESPNLHSKGNIGVDKPNTEGDKPAFY